MRAVLTGGTGFVGGSVARALRARGHEVVAHGILRVLDAGRVGESYVLAGECLRLAHIVERAAAAAGRTAPRLTVPDRARRELGWQPWPFDAGLHEVLAPTMDA